MYNTNTKVSRAFMRRMILAYKRDLLKHLAHKPELPGRARAQDRLFVLEQIRQQTFSQFEQTITF